MRLSSWFLRPSVMGALFAELRLAWRLVKEPRVPGLVKTLPALALLYVLSPFDFVPDVLPFLGQVDDIGILLIAMKAFLKLSPQAALAHHAAAITSGRRYAPMSPSDIVIDATCRRD